jgi:hypothetical protein
MLSGINEDPRSTDEADNASVLLLEWLVRVQTQQKEQKQQTDLNLAAVIMLSEINEGPRSTDEADNASVLLLEWLVRVQTQQKEQKQQPSTSDKVWEPCLQWDVHDAPLGNDARAAVSSRPAVAPSPSLESFRYVIDILTDKRSSFARKLIVCGLTRTAKTTLLGRTLKITCDRFGPN